MSQVARRDAEGSDMLVVTPPPSYTIFLSSGDSEFVPPAYKTIFPTSCNSSAEEELGAKGEQ